jgi:hypothetical protein
MPIAIRALQGWAPPASGWPTFSNALFAPLDIHEEFSSCVVSAETPVRGSIRLMVAHGKAAKPVAEANGRSTNRSACPALPSFQR